ncbi:MAG TPA: hypothetical protein VFF31_22880 [Blastocatellia bacterium]|nr:hypothetical protein [Blastocatellia bacterium]
MNVKNYLACLLVLISVLGFVPISVAQDTQPQSSDQDKDKPTPEKKAMILLDQIVGEAGGLRLPENRIYVQIAAGDLLWVRDEARARILFGEAGSSIADMMRRSDAPNDPNNRRAANANRIALELRQELVLTVARHSGEFAYQLLQAMPAPAQTAPADRRQNQNTLEQSLVAAIAANDPKSALKNAQGWLEKGEYPSSLSKVLSQLYSKDAEAATKLSEQLAKKLQPEEIVLKLDAVRLSLSLLRPGPRPEKKSGDATQPIAGSTDQLLAESAYRDVMSATVTAALRATPQPQNTQQRGGPGQFRGRPNNAGGPAAAQQAPQQNEAEIAQANARMLLNGLQNLQAQVDKYLPERSLALRQKFTQMGMDRDPRAGFGQMAALMEQGTSESLIAAAASAPQGMQNRIYQQAALKALNEGNPDRARDIANQHLEGTARTNLLHTLELKQAVKSAPDKMDEIRQTLNRAQSDDERVSLLLQFASNLQTENPKLALQVLDEARGFVTRRATNYGQFEAQVNVARAYETLDPSRSFDTLEPGINQINELLSAAAILSGFEVNIFKDGELPLKGGGSLTGLVTRYGAALASLARVDFEKAQLLTERFQLAEPRVLARLTMVRGVLGVTPVDSANRGFGPNPGGQFGRRP